MTWVLAFFTVSGLSFTLWALVGLARFATEKVNKKPLAPHKTFITGLAIAVIGISSLIGSLLTFGFLIVALIVWLFFIMYIGFIVGRFFSTAWQTILSISFLLILYLILALLNNSEVYVLFVLQGVALLLGGHAASIVAQKERRAVKKKSIQGKPHRILPSQVVAITPAHNEEISIARTIISLKKILPNENIYVASDGSTDKTIEIATKLGVQVVDIQPNRGKAGALNFVIQSRKLTSRYKAVLIVDADAELDRKYLRNALVLFEDPDIVAVATHVFTKWHKHLLPQWSMFFPAYRVRLYRILQAVMRYGQTWKYTSVSPIIPGFAGLYRTSILPRINIAASGLVIEDFNMTFEVHHKKLGRIGYHPSAFGISQDPYSLNDYIKQVLRWNLGLWQTIRKHGIWPSMFWFFFGIFILEMLMYSFFFLLIPIVLVWFTLNSFAPISIFSLNPFGLIELTLRDVLIGVFLVDYLTTIIVAYIEKKPVLLLYGLGFCLFRVIDSFNFLYTLPLAFVIKSKGKWESPQRK